MNIFYSNKEDLVDIDKYLALNGDYYSPQAMTQSYNLGIRTTFSNVLESSFIFNHNYYDYGYKTDNHPEYFQFQKITTLDMSFIYNTDTLWGKVNSGFNLSVGRGNTKFTQFTIKVGTHIEIVEDLHFNINMNYKIKTIGSDTNFNNYSMIAYLKYKF